VGIISSLTALVVGAYSFFTIRFLLGLAEAGFFPGIILYLTWWFPSFYRSRITAVFMAAIPISNIIGSVWDGITQLPDDVAIRTSDHNGHRLKLLHRLWGDWIEATRRSSKPRRAFQLHAECR
jgi:hypothetical protein